jgi:hypothetical protein
MIHIHNGDVVLGMARKAGLPGEHVAFRESLVGGPVREGEEWLSTRAKFLAQAHDHDLLRTSNALFEQEQMLASLASHDEVVLWFEHDLFCLIHLLYVIQRVPRAKTYLVWHDHPISELKPEELWRAYRRRGAITSDMIAIARDAWKAYTAPDPTGLNRFLKADGREFPFLAEGMLLQATRFPSMRNGLGIIEQRLLEFIEEGAADFEALFNRFSRAQQKFGFADTEILRHLRSLASRRVPLANVMEAKYVPRIALTITDHGQALLREGDDIAINGIDTWLGGVHLTTENVWRWDPQKGEIVRTTS